MTRGSGAVRVRYVIPGPERSLGPGTRHAHPALEEIHERHPRPRSRRPAQGRPQQLGQVGGGRRGRRAELPRPRAGARRRRPGPPGQDLLHPAPDRRPEGRPGVARSQAGRAHADHGRVDLGRRRRAGLPRRPALRRRHDQRLPPGLHAVRRPRPRVVRRPDVERLRRPHLHRRDGQGQRRADRAEGGRGTRRPARHGPVPRARPTSSRPRPSRTRTSSPAPSPRASSCASATSW